MAVHRIDQCDFTTCFYIKQSVVLLITESWIVRAVKYLTVGCSRQVQKRIRISGEAIMDNYNEL
jgi:hypothetical protein